LSAKFTKYSNFFVREVRKEVRKDYYNNNNYNIMYRFMNYNFFVCIRVYLKIKAHK